MHNFKTIKNIITSLIILTYSCETIPRIKKSEINPITKEFSGNFENKPYIIHSTNGISIYDSSFTILKLCDTAGTIKQGAGSITLNLISDNKLNLSYRDSSLFQAITLKGKISKKGYFEVYFKNERFEIPPVVHVLFSTHKINRIRIFVTKANDVIINRFYYISGNFLFMGDGPSKMQFYFHRIGQN